MTTNYKRGIIAAVKTEITLLALVALITEGAIAGLATQADKSAVSEIIFGMIVVLLSIICVAALSIFLNRRGPRSTTSAETDQPDVIAPTIRALPYLASRTEALTGMWKGTVKQVHGPDGQPLQAEAVITFGTSKPKITGKGSFRYTPIGHELVQREFEFMGGFLFDRFLRFEYNSIDSKLIEFGSVVLELEPDSKVLNGHYVAYGVGSQKIVYGGLLLTKAS